MAYRDNVYRPDEQKERDRMLAKEDAKIRAKVARRRAKSSRVSDKDIKSRKDALKKAQPLTPYKRVIRSKKTQEGVVARLRAKQEGRKAAVRIAKARAAKQKKAPFTRLAVGYNAAAEKSRSEANRIRNEAGKKLMTESTPRQFRKLTGMRKKGIVRAGTPGRMLEFMGHLPEVSKLRDRAQMQKDLSKDFARRSGGHATAMKRNAESGIGHIVRGRAMKGVARASGVLGIASLFAQHLGGKGKKNG